MEHIHHIRYEHKVNSKSLRAIARETGHDVKTVKKYVEMEDFSPREPRKLKRSSKSDKYRKTVKEWLEKDKEAPKKQRHTARRVYSRLIEKHGNIDVSERTIRTLVADLRKEIGQSEVAALPLLHPGGEAQADFGHTLFYEKEKECAGNHLCLSFPHSDGNLTQLFKSENLECLMQGLTDIFHAIGGVPTAIWFDNTSAIVKNIKSNGEREITEAFRRFQCHYGFKSNFCNPGVGREKGSVENYVGYSRRHFFVPVPEFDDLEAYNTKLLEDCFKDMDRDHYKIDERVSKLFEADQAALLPLPKEEYDCCKYVWAKTDNRGLASFATNKYSTSGNLARSKVLLKIKAHSVTVLDEDHREIVSHPRIYGKKKVSILWGPYLKVIARRPGALKYTEFFESLESSIQDFLNKEDLDGKKAILNELAKGNDIWGFENTLQGISQSIRLGAKDADELISALHFVMSNPGKIPKNYVPDHLPLTEEYTLALREYGKFMGGDNYV